MTTYAWTDNMMRGGSTCDVDKVADNLMHLKYNIVPSLLTRNAVNSGKTDTAGNPNVLSYSSNIISVDDGTCLSDYQGNSWTIATPITLTPTELLPNAKYNLFTDINRNISYYAQAQLGKDLLVDFSQGNANDNYELHNPIIIGSPSFANGKFNSNGNTGLAYPLPVGSGSWCIQQKFKSTNTNTLQILLYTENAYTIQLSKNTGNKMALYLSSNGSSNNIASAVLGTKDWAVDVEYYIRVRFDQPVGKYYVDWSTDYDPLTELGTWTNDITVTSSVVVYPFSLLYFGITSSSTYPLIGTMANIRVTIGDSICRHRNKYKIANTDLYPRTNDLLFNTSGEPCLMKQWNGTAWVSTSLVPCGSFCTNSSSQISSVVQPNFNQNGYTINRDSVSVLLPNYKAGISKTLSTQYTAECDGWIYFAAGDTTSLANPILTIDGVVFQPSLTGGTSSMYAGLFMPVSKGSTYIATTATPLYYVFYPAMKGGY